MSGSQVNFESFKEKIFAEFDRLGDRLAKLEAEVQDLKAESAKRKRAETMERAKPKR